MRIIAILLLCIQIGNCQTLEKGKQLFESQKYDDAKAMLSKIAMNRNEYAAAQYYLGRIAFNQKNLDKAQSHFEEAIEKNDKVADYYYWYGSTLGSIAQNANSFKQGMLAPKIKNAFENTVRLDPKNIDAHWGLIEFYTQAPGFMGGSWEKAETTAKGISKINQAEGHRALAIVFERKEKLTEAENELIKGVQVNPDLVYTLSNFYVRHKKYSEAFTLFEEVAKREPENMMAVYQMGKISAISGHELNKGEQALTRYLGYQPKEREPSHAGANMRLAQIKEKKGLKTEAKKLYETALKADPSLKEAEEGLKRVK